jgi:hypothetical protein
MVPWGKCLIYDIILPSMSLFQIPLDRDPASSGWRRPARGCGEGCSSRNADINAAGGEYDDGRMAL